MQTHNSHFTMIAAKQKSVDSNYCWSVWEKMRTSAWKSYLLGKKLIALGILSIIFRPPFSCHLRQKHALHGRRCLKLTQFLRYKTQVIQSYLGSEYIIFGFLSHQYSSEVSIHHSTQVLNLRILHARFACRLYTTSKPRVGWRMCIAYLIVTQPGAPWVQGLAENFWLCRW